MSDSEEPPQEAAAEGGADAAPPEGEGSNPQAGDDTLAPGDAGEKKERAGSARSRGSPSPARKARQRSAGKRPSVNVRGGMKPEMMAWHADRNGSGPVAVSWQPGGRFVATFGSNGSLIIAERLGTVVTKAQISGAFVDMGWDHQGEVLAVATAGTEIVTLWDKTTRESKQLKTGLKEGISVLKWQREGSRLAICSNSGNLVIYDDATKRKAAFQNRHSKGIKTASWSSANLLALGGEDKKVTVCQEDGTMVENQGIKSLAPQMMFAEKAGKGSSHNAKKVVAMNLTQTVYMLDLDDRDQPTELAFQPKYGDIACFRWVGDEMMIGFAEGYFIVIQTSARHIGQELISTKLFPSSVIGIEYCAALNQIAVAGEDQVKIFTIGQWTVVQDTFKIPKSNGAVSSLSWTTDGRLLSVATTGGSVHTFITEIPLVSAYHGIRWCNLTGLQTIGLWHTTDRNYESKIKLTIEPSHLALGPEHCVAAQGHTVHVFGVDMSGGNNHSDLGKRQMPGKVEALGCSGTRYAALCDGRVYIRSLAGGGRDEDGEIVLPEGDGTATSMVMTDHFVIFGTAAGELFYFNVQDEAVTSAYRPSKSRAALVSIFPNNSGTRCVIVNADNKALMYSPVTDSSVPMEKFPEGVTKVLWDVMDRGVLVACTKNCARMFTYVHVPASASGEQVRFLAVTKSPKRQSGVVMHNGSLVVLDNHGAATTGTLTSHDALGNITSMTPEKARRCFQQCLALIRLAACWDMAEVMQDDDLWEMLAKEALRVMDTKTALAAYRHLNDIPMAMALESLEEIEERNLLAGHISLLLGEYSSAEQLFVASSQPIRALEMRRSMQHYDEALDLAGKYAKDQVPFISYEYALQLEYQQSFKDALRRYQEAAIADGEHDEHDLKCKAGEVRMLIRLGDTAGGVKLALAIGEVEVFREAGNILASIKQFQDAALMFEKGQQWDKAVTLYFQGKNYTAAAPLMDKVTSPKLFQTYGEFLEREKKFPDAERAYVKAKALVDVIRLNLSHLNNPGKGFELVRRSRNQEGARLVAEFCQRKGDYKTAVEFMLLAKLKDDAFQVAAKNNQMDAFADALGDAGSLHDYEQMATYYDKKGHFERAGTLYAKCQDYPRAMERFLQGAEKHGAAMLQSMQRSPDGKTADPADVEAQGACIDFAIEVVGVAKDPNLTSELFAFLMDTTDGIPKNVLYIFKAHMALGNYEEAANMAVVLAKQEQDEGNYKKAHGLLFDTFQHLLRRGLVVPMQLRRNLMLLHSYILARLLVRLKDHKSGARMLVRVGNNISKFPKHTVGILTSAVVTCQRAGLKTSAYNFAKVLVRPEHRSQLDKNYKKKIEQLVRKPDLSEDEDPFSPCPNCDNQLLPQTELNCPDCKTSLPFCIITGRHMKLDDWSQCPSCQFPALFGPFRKYIQAAKKCPMCENTIQVSQIAKNNDPKAALKALLM